MMHQNLSQILALRAMVRPAPAIVRKPGFLEILLSLFRK